MERQKDKDTVRKSIKRDKEGEKVNEVDTRKEGEIMKDREARKKRKEERER